MTLAAADAADERHCAMVQRQGTLTCRQGGSGEYTEAERELPLPAPFEAPRNDNGRIGAARRGSLLGMQLPQSLGHGGLINPRALLIRTDANSPRGARVSKDA